MLLRSRRVVLCVGIVGVLAVPIGCGGGSAPPVTAADGGPLDLRDEVLLVVTDVTGRQSAEEAVPLRLVRLSDPDGTSIRLGSGTSIETSTRYAPFHLDDTVPAAPLPLTDPLVVHVNGGDDQPSHCRRIELMDPAGIAPEVECPSSREPVAVGRWTVSSSGTEITDTETGERSLAVEPDALQHVWDVHVDAQAIAVSVRLAGGKEVLDLITPSGRRTVVDPPFFHRVRDVRFDATGQVLLAAVVGADASELRRIPLDGGPSEVVLEGSVGRWMLAPEGPQPLLVFATDPVTATVRVLRGDAVQGEPREIARLDAALVVKVALGEDETVWLQMAGGRPGAPTMYTVHDDVVEPLDTGSLNVANVLHADGGSTLVGFGSRSDADGGYTLRIVAVRGGNPIEVAQLPWEHVEPLDLSSDGTTLHVAGKLDDDGAEAHQHGIWRIDLDGEARPVRVSDQLVMATIGARGFLRWKNTLALE